MITLAVIACCLSILPAAMFLRNLSAYRPLPRDGASSVPCSVLIPARNEERNIGDALRSILQNEDVDLEVVVLDDHSADRTAEIVGEIAARDARVRLEKSQPLPFGWCGKTFACHQLATLARHSVLLFMDADVRVTRSDSLPRTVNFLKQSGASFVSGVPHQQTGTFSEKLLVPLIHFVLLGFLPIRWMRRNLDPKFAAACGQLIAVERARYERAGGHAAIAASLHDGIALARKFRTCGYKTDLFDATDTFTCRMYRNTGEVLAGLAKNTQEGLGSPRLLGPSTVLLLGGQLVPLFILLASSSREVITIAAVACLAALLPRFVAALRFRQSLLGAVFHPLGVLILVAIQWYGFARSLGGAPASWKGRTYAPSPAT